jgi:predicted ester cyclase
VKGVCSLSTEDNKALIRWFFEEVYTKKNVAAIEAFISANHIDHSASTVGSPAGPKGSRQLIGMMLAAFPDLRVTFEDMIAAGDKVVVRLTMHGTQQGALGSLPPTGKQVTVSTIDSIRIEGGQIAEEWGIDDRLGMLQQLGLVPAKG